MFKLPFGKLKFGKIAVNKSTAVVEIGNDWLKVAQNSHSPSGDEITAISLHKLSGIKENMSEAVSRIFKEAGLNRQSVILSIPRHLITVRSLDLPSTDPNEIGDIISLQVGKQTPYSKEEIISTHKIMPSAREGYAKVLLAIAHKNIINERLGILRNAGITVGRVTISSEGVYNWFKLSYSPEIRQNDPETIALLDIDSNYSDFIAIRGGSMVFTKNIFIGANHLTEDPTPWRNKLIEELKRCIERYYIEEKNAKITKILLSGAVAEIENLDVVLASAIDTSFEKADTFRNIKIKPGVLAAQGENMKFVSLTPLVGTAIKNKSLSLDLTPPELKILKMMENKRKDLTIMGVLFVSLVMISSFLLLIGFYYKSAALAGLKKKISDLSRDSGEIEKMRASVELAKRTLDAKGSSLNILHEIYRSAPQGISFTSLDVDEDKQVVLKGRGFAMSDVFKLIKKLEESSMFQDVKASYTRTKKEKEGDVEREYAEFEVVCHYEKH